MGRMGRKGRIAGREEGQDRRTGGRAGWQDGQSGRVGLVGHNESGGSGRSGRSGRSGGRADEQELPRLEQRVWQGLQRRRSYLPKSFANRRDGQRHASCCATGHGRRTIAWKTDCDAHRRVASRNRRPRRRVCTSRRVGARCRVDDSDVGRYHRRRGDVFRCRRLPRDEVTHGWTDLYVHVRRDPCRGRTNRRRDESPRRAPACRQAKVAASQRRWLRQAP